MQIFIYMSAVINTCMGFSLTPSYIKPAGFGEPGPLLRNRIFPSYRNQIKKKKNLSPITFNPLEIAIYHHNQEHGIWKSVSWK